MKSDHGKSEMKYQMWGWILFIICALFFIGAGVQNRDFLTTVGSVVFLAACIAFLIPLIRNHNNKDRRN